MSEVCFMSSQQSLARIWNAWSPLSWVCWSSLWITQGSLYRLGSVMCVCRLFIHASWYIQTRSMCTDIPGATCVGWSMFVLIFRDYPGGLCIRNTGWMLVWADLRTVAAPGRSWWTPASWQNTSKDGQRSFLVQKWGFHGVSKAIPQSYGWFLIKYG